MEVRWVDTWSTSRGHTEISGSQGVLSVPVCYCRSFELGPGGQKPVAWFRGTVV